MPFSFEILNCYWVYLTIGIKFSKRTDSDLKGSAMNQNDSSSNEVLLYRQEIIAHEEIFGIEYEYQFAVIYLKNGFFYIDYPSSITVNSFDPKDITIGDIEEIKITILKNVILELKKAPHFTESVFGLQYMPNPKVDPNYDGSINPFADI